MNEGSDMGQAAKAVRDSVSQVGQSVRDAGSQVRDAAQEKFENLRDQAGEYYEQGRQRAQEWEAGLEEYVQEKPLQSLLIAAGVGALLALLWKRH
jgi:ElaB/YqjD/DUF883 family membrane-anchored ribosome-binding protein